MEQEITSEYCTAVNSQEKNEQMKDTVADFSQEEETINEENLNQMKDNATNNEQTLIDGEAAAVKERVNIKETFSTTTTIKPDASSQVVKKIQISNAGTKSSIRMTEESNHQKKPQSNPRILWITNVAKNTRANELKQLLSSCGKVVCAKVVVNARFPGSCCFGYVTMGSADDALKVITKFNNTEFNGQIIKIDKFENIKADSLNIFKNDKNDENTTQVNEDEDNNSKKKSVSAERYQEKEKNVETSSSSFERKKSGTSEISSHVRRISPSNGRIREREKRYQHSTLRSTHCGSVLTFDKIKEEREKQRMRERERALRENSRRRHEETIRLREMHEISKRQKNEAERLEREREKLRIERDKIEHEKNELIKLERERQRIERERLEMKKTKLQRSRLRLQGDIHDVKNQVPLVYGRVETREERKKFTSDKHFEESCRFVPAYCNDQMSRKLIPSQEFNSPLYQKHELYPKKRIGFNNSNRHHIPSINRYTLYNYDKSYDKGRDAGIDSLDRSVKSDVNIRFNDSKYIERERSPQFRSPSNGRVANRWNFAVVPQLKVGLNQNFWNNKGTSWTPEVSSAERWNKDSSSGSLDPQSFNNFNLSPSCPSPPGVNNYSDRFEYNKFSNSRKY